MIVARHEHIPVIPHRDIVKAHKPLRLDVDCLDPAFAPGTGADEPGGLTSAEVLAFVRMAAPRVHALDIVEVNPLADLHNATSILAAQIIFTAVSARVVGP